jgi:MoaA/NifB/PqqE/SkfB family radical SAM enzyme
VSEIKYLGIAVTNRCNLACKHCCFNCGIEGVDIDLDLAKKAIDGAKRHRITHLSITGGEPLLHPGIREIVQYASDSGMHIALDTNGYLLERNLDWIKDYNVNLLAVSLSGATEKTHDAIRGAGSFQKTLQALSLARQNFNVYVKYVIDKNNLQEINLALELLKRIGVSQISFTNVFPLGRAVENKLIISEQEALDCQKQVNKKASQLGLNNVVFFSSYEKNRLCDYIREGHLFLAWDGKMYLCCNLPDERFLIGDLREDNFGECIAKNEKFRDGFYATSLEKNKQINCEYCAEAMGYKRKKQTLGLKEIGKRVSGIVSRAFAPEGLSLKIPSQVTILLNNFCNQNCLYCHFDCESSGTELELELLKKLLDEFKILGIHSIQLNGGEPLMYSRLDELLGYATKLGISSLIITDGWLLKEKIKSLRKYNIQGFFIGLDGITAKAHDKIRGKSGSFERAMSAIAASQENGYYTGVNFVATPDNFDEFNGFLDFIERKNINSLQVIKVIWDGRALKNRAKLTLTSAQEKLVGKILSGRTELAKKTSITSQYLYGGFGSCKYLDLISGAIDWDGNVNACSISCGYGIKFPSIKEKSYYECLVEINRINTRFASQRSRANIFNNHEEFCDFCSYCLGRFKKKDLKVS